MSAELKCLDRRFRPMAEALLAFGRARLKGNFQVSSSCRTRAEQARLYADRANNPFPVLPPGHSMHERGLAVDIHQPGIDPYHDLSLHVLGALWRETDPSLRWGESDPIHFEWRPPG